MGDCRFHASPCHPLTPSSVSMLQGVAINFVTNDDERLLQDIQRFYNTVIEVRCWACLRHTVLSPRCVRPSGPR